MEIFLFTIFFGSLIAIYNSTNNYLQDPESKSNKYESIMYKLKDKNYEILDSMWNYITIGQYCFVAVNKDKFYINTKWNWEGGSANHIDDFYEYKDITWSDLKIQTTTSEKIIKKDVFKKALIGGFVFGKAGAITGAMFGNIKSEELITHIALHLKIKNVEGTVPILFFQNALGTKVKNIKFLFDVAIVEKWYSYLIEKDFSNLPQP
jgi:hypothetical protein